MPFDVVADLHGMVTLKLWLPHRIFTFFGELEEI